MTNDATGIPSAWYCTGEPFQHERRTVFASEWQMLGRTSLLQQPGEFVTANLGGWPLFALVAADGTIGAFRNVCRHQGMQVLEKPKGRCETLRCRYHGWTYDFSGRMIATPDLVAPADPASPDNHLCRIASTAWHGLLFVNVDPDARAFDAPLGEFGAAVAPALNRCTHAAGEVTTDYNCNWKTYVEHCIATRDFGTDGPDALWLWHWPLLMVHVAPFAVCVQQIVPRTFGRSRVIDHLFVADARDAAHAAAVIEAAKRRAATDKPACEEMQQRRESDVPADDPRLAAFHQQIRVLHARPPRDYPLALQQSGG